MRTTIWRSVFGCLSLTALLVSLLSPTPVTAQDKTGDDPTKKKSTSNQWKPSGKQILEFVESALKDPKVDRSQVEQVLSDISSGKAVFEMEQAGDAKLAVGPCVRMACRSRPCATYLGGSRYSCNNCCISMKKDSSSLGTSPNECNNETYQQSSLIKDATLQ
jgi:hypothetical protein